VLELKDDITMTRAREGGTSSRAGCQEEAGAVS